MKILFNFSCGNCKNNFEKYTAYTQTTECPSCSGQADKLISAPTIKLEGISGAFPGAAMSWEKKHKFVPSQDE